MQTLLNILIKHNHWFLFILLEGISFMLIVRFNNYQGATFFTATNKLVGDTYSLFMNVNTYFNLHNENNKLLLQNKLLQEELTTLRGELDEYKSKYSLLNDSTVIRHRNEYIFSTAQVVNNSLNAVNNYVVLNKGTDDGVEAEMGVFDANGVVGVIYLASKKYSLVIPLLNSKSNINCRVRGSDSFCALQWDGKDPRYSNLVDLPRYTKFEKGDTVVTSGFSTIFPGDIPVGTIDNIENSQDGMFYKAKVKLFTDFSSLTSVYIVGNKSRKEMVELESKIPQE